MPSGVHGPRVRNSKLAVERAKAYLNERFNELVSLDDLAAVARVSRFHLVHAFTKETRLAPHAYQMHIRVERARGLLQRGMSAAGAAASVGFADQSHFTRCFKRVMRVRLCASNSEELHQQAPGPACAALAARRGSEAGDLITQQRLKLSA
jgi:AraC-like DNA-binding protein